MDKKVIGLGLGAIAVMAIGYWLSQQPRSFHASPEPVVLQDKAADADIADNGFFLYGEGEMHPYEDSCPDMTGAVRLDFTGEMTEDIYTFVKDYEKVTRSNEFIEEGQTHLIDYVDLNEDGRMDFVTIYNARNWCGSAGCMVEVFIQNEEGGYSSHPFVYSAKGGIYVTNEVENGFRKVIVAGNPHSLDGTKQLWVWLNNAYKRYGNCPGIDLEAVDAAIDGVSDAAPEVEDRGE